MPAVPPRSIITSLADLSESQVAQVASRCGLGVPPGRVEDVCSCTPMQLEMIRADRDEVLHFVVRFGPGADIDRFCVAVRDVVAANSVLRTRLVPLDVDDGDGGGREIVQVVLAGEHVVARRAVGGGGGRTEEDDEVRLYIEDGVGAEPMGLGQPLFRTVFIGRTWIASVHHAVVDYWSITTLLDVDLPLAYFGRGPVPRPAFSSFVARCLALDDEAAASRFWGSRFQVGASAAAIFPPPASATATATARRHHQHHRIVAEPEQRIALPRVADGTVPQLHMPFFIEAAWALTASVLSGRSEAVVYGCVLSGRSPPLPGGLEKTLGPTLAEVPVQAVLSWRTTTVGRLVRDRAAALRELLRQDPALLHCGPERIAQLAGGGVAATTAAAFTAVINVRPVAADGTTTARSDAEGQQHESGDSKDTNSNSNGSSNGADLVKLDRVVWVRGSHPLQLVFGIRADGVALWTRSDAEAMGRRTLARVLAQLGHSLRLLTEAAPETRLDALPLLNPDAAAEIARWNDGATRLPSRRTLIHALFEAQVRERPRAVAAGELTYSALDGLACRLAGQLRRLGVRRGARVGLLSEPSVWAAVAVLGILKAGAAYVPVDPREEKHHHRRKAYLAAAGVRIALTSVAEHARSVGTAEHVLVLGDGDGQIPGGLPLDCVNGGGVEEKEQQQEEEATPDDVACIISTSGITVPARAVELTHANLTCTLASLAERLGWGPGCRMLQSAPLVTGTSVLETLGALGFGGCLCAGPTVRSATDVPRLSAFIASAGVNWAILHPHVLSRLSPDAVPGLASVLATGDRVTDEIRKLWSTPGRRFFVGWGATEASVVSTVAEVQDEASQLGGVSTCASGSDTGVGEPVGCAIWIVNPSNVDELAPLGGVGELLIEGPGLAASHRYLSDGDIRASKASFISAPRWATAARSQKQESPRFFFRTGDLGRYDLESAAPSIRLLGRSDNCVMVAGAAQRRSTVHLEQIEAVISASDLVREVVVVSRIAAGRTALVAVVGLEDGQPSSPRGAAVPQMPLVLVHDEVADRTLEGIREYVGSRLPAEQVPSMWVVVEQLPRTVSYKVDRGAVKRWLKTNTA